jgi:hypothetical protein
VISWFFKFLLSHSTCTATARDAAKAKAAAEDAAAKEKGIVAAHEIHMVKLRNDMATLRNNTVAKLKRKDEQWQAQVDQLRTALQTMRGGGVISHVIGGGGGGGGGGEFGSAIASKLFSLVNTARLKKTMEGGSEGGVPRAREDGEEAGGPGVDELKGEVYELKEQLRLAHVKVEEKERAMKEASRRAVEKQAKLRREMREKMAALTTGGGPSLGGGGGGGLNTQKREAIELRNELDVITEDLLATEEALIDRLDEASRLQRETAFAKAQTKMTSLAMGAKMKIKEAKRAAGDSSAAAELEEERRRVEQMSLQLSEMRARMSEATEEVTAMRSAEAAAAAAATDRLHHMRESVLAAGDDQVGLHSLPGDRLVVRFITWTIPAVIN